MTLKDFTEKEAKDFIYKHYGKADEAFLDVLVGYWSHSDGTKKNKTKKYFVEALNELKEIRKNSKK